MSIISYLWICPCVPKDVMICVRMRLQRIGGRKFDCPMLSEMDSCHYLNMDLEKVRCYGG